LFLRLSYQAASPGCHVVRPNPSCVRCPQVSDGLQVRAARFRGGSVGTPLFTWFTTKNLFFAVHRFLRFHVIIGCSHADTYLIRTSGVVPSFN
jgi:hypothetical protein